jgi:hypothetical protein
VNKPGEVAKENFMSTNPEDESNEESRYQESFGTKVKEDGHIYAHYSHTTSAMNFSDVISATGANCFSHGTDSRGNFMDVYGTQSRGPQKNSTDLKLFMIRVDYDHDLSEEEMKVTTTGTAATTVSTIASTTASSTISMTTFTSVVTTSVNYAAVIPQHIHQAYHENPVVNNRLRAWFKLLWEKQVCDEYLQTAVIEHVLPT